MAAFDFLNPGKGYKEAGKEYEKYYNQAKNFQMPYYQSGIDQIQKLMDAENRLLNPADLQSEWSKGYETSPYAKQLQQEASSQGLDAASSMGLLGSSTALSNIQQGSSNIMQRDRDKYMNDLMEKYMKGIGIGQNMYGTGAGAASNIAGNAMNQGNRMGEAAYGQNNAMGDWLRTIMNQGMKGAIGYYTGGMGI